MYVVITIHRNIYQNISSEKDLIYYAYDIVNYYDDVKNYLKSFRFLSHQIDFVQLDLASAFMSFCILPNFLNYHLHAAKEDKISYKVTLAKSYTSVGIGCVATD